ncbi:tripartite motif-containing protein 29-like [Salvelinus alpinus]|uniref:tripartite motif-containing protein 29-like n=1 Tax=Salvelinus alpinus TaxID=8036 RepID=UPI0039FD3A7B
MATPPVFKEGDLTQKEDIGPGEMVCDVCDDVKAVKSCLTCNQHYCETHVKKHYTVPKLQRHTLVAVTGELEERLCQEHHRALEVFCRTDQTMICSQCVVTEHKGHDTDHDEIKRAGRQTEGEEQHRNQVLNEGSATWGDLRTTNSCLSRRKIF